MSTEPSEIDAEAEADRLYPLPLDAFVEARNALAARLKSNGDKSGAARVKALARPSVSAWAVNQVYWQARPEFDALMASVERLQRAQLPGTVGGSELRDAMKARREAQDLVLRRAVALLTSAGHGTNPATLQRVSNTLEALAAGAGHAAQVRPGRLVQDLEPLGFEALSAIAEAEPAPASPRRDPAAETSPAAAPHREDESLARLRAALHLSEQRLERARREAREAAGALSVAEKRAEGARGELADATRRFERAQERAAAMAEDETAARLKAERLAASREAAETERDAALGALRAAE